MQVLVTEVYKVKNGIAPEIMKDIFQIQNEKRFDKALKNIPAVSEDLQRIDWNYLKIALII